MMDKYEPKYFWNERFLEHGHTGDVNKLIYNYDQPQRLRAIKAALRKAGVSVNSKTKILDIGCGTGDVINLFLQYKNPPEITGIDISDEIINHTRKRFIDYPQVRLSVSGIEEFNFAESSFGLVVGINVLQHIIDPAAFLKAAKNIVNAVKIDGYILIMDFSPIKVKNRGVAPYVVIRSREEYINIFNDQKCKMICEFGLPRIGVRLCGFVYKFGARAFGQKNISQTAVKDAAGQRAISYRIKASIWYIIQRVILTTTLPLDYLLMPLPARYTDMRVLIFKKLS
jgi:ubiquinone/menaquinone biosynthesis C-methylase UbiE